MEAMIGSPAAVPPRAVAGHSYADLRRRRVPGRARRRSRSLSGP